MASGLRGQVTPPIAERLDKLVEEAREKWAELKQGTETRKEGGCGSAREVRWGLIGQCGISSVGGKVGVGLNDLCQEGQAQDDLMYNPFAAGPP